MCGNRHLEPPRCAPTPPLTLIPHLRPPSPSGSASHEDIVVSSARAYTSALNKMIGWMNVNRPSSSKSGASSSSSSSSKEAVAAH